jgi:hypothetical protein
MSRWIACSDTPVLPASASAPVLAPAVLGPPGGPSGGPDEGLGKGSGSACADGLGAWR